MTLSTKESRLRLRALTATDRVALYADALEAWKRSLELREMAAGFSPEEARSSVRARHATSRQEGYAQDVQRERNAFMDRFVAAALA